jgi:hypothetical protein
MLVSAVPTKPKPLKSASPFATYYRQRVGDGFIVINGEQITRIETNRIEKEDEDGWEVVFHLADGHTHTIAPSSWTKKFVNTVFDLDKENEDS